MQDPQTFVEMGFLGVISSFVSVGYLCTLNPTLVHDVNYMHLEFHCLSWGMSAVLHWFSFVNKIVIIYISML